MSDTAADTIDLLETLLTQTEAAQLLAKGAELVAIGGVEGIQYAALHAPQLLLDTIDRLASALISVNDSYVKSVMRELEMEDQIANLLALIPPPTGK